MHLNNLKKYIAYMLVCCHAAVFSGQAASTDELPEQKSFFAEHKMGICALGGLLATALLARTLLYRNKKSGQIDTPIAQTESASFTVTQASHFINDLIADIDRKEDVRTVANKFQEKLNSLSPEEKNTVLKAYNHIYTNTTRTNSVNSFFTNTRPIIDELIKEKIYNDAESPEEISLLYQG